MANTDACCQSVAGLLTAEKGINISACCLFCSYVVSPQIKTSMTQIGHYSIMRAIGDIARDSLFFSFLFFYLQKCAHDFCSI